MVMHSEYDFCTKFAGDAQQTNRQSNQIVTMHNVRAKLFKEFREQSLNGGVRNVEIIAREIFCYQPYTVHSYIVVSAACGFVASKSVSDFPRKNPHFMSLFNQRFSVVMYY